MEFHERMNRAIGYIEDHLPEEIDYEQAARAACCPHHFWRMFSFITGMTLSEYVRRRRLTLAAEELGQGSRSILDIAVKYGYDSAAAFSRAFRAQHGVSPAAVRRGEPPAGGLEPLSFPPEEPEPRRQTYRMVKGTMKMATLVQIEFAPFGPCRFMGKAIRTRALSNDIHALWVRCFSDGTYDRLLALTEYIPDDIADDYVGLITGFHPADGSFDYMAGMFMKPGAPIPEGYAFHDIPACTMARAWIEGEEYDLYSGAHELTLQAMEQQGYEPDGDNPFCCEVYTGPRFCAPKDRGERVLILDYCIPYRKRSG